MGAARRMLRLRAMDAVRPRSETEALDTLLRRAALVVRHHLYRRQPLEVADVVARVLQSSERRPGELARYRGHLGQAVAALIHPLR
jgi:hypothetical protein